MQKMICAKILPNNSVQGGHLEEGFSLATAFR